ncbi:MAG: cysteine hydrolase [Candidatus Eremiobacteraeota bacterium]|nr:cysteine hydrolase [Candidatus Eremiobacteraeota bacterium]
MSTALLVMDYQSAIVAQMQDPTPLLDNVAAAIETARSHGAYIGFVRVAFTHAEYDAVPNSNKGFTAAKASGRDFRDGSPATAIFERIAPKEGDIVVRKIRVGAFSTTDLHGRLRERNVDTLILSGISTSGVVLSTVRDAADRDYRLFVLSDACADPQPDVHAFLIEKIFPRQADVITCGDLGSILSS